MTRVRRGEGPLWTPTPPPPEGAGRAVAGEGREIATYNATSWRSRWAYARVSIAAVILGQAHHLRGGEIDDAGRAARRLGWLIAW